MIIYSLEQFCISSSRLAVVAVVLLAVVSAAAQQKLDVIKEVLALTKVGT